MAHTEAGNPLSGTSAINVPEPAAGSSRNVGSQIDRRRAKLDALQADDAHPLQYRFDADHSAADLAGSWADLPAGSRTGERVSVAGRLMLVRRHGGLIFGVVRDRTGTIQVFVDRRAVGEDTYRRFRALDRGDWIGVSGTVMRTDKGELSVALEEFETLGKALRPPPDKDKGLVDVEVRYRQRYVDLMTNERTRRIFEIRRRVIRAIRGHLDDRGFWEVEGPMLGSIQGGATARPFISHHNALDIDMYLRIALELHLKRLVVGGMERVFEIGRVFRNEGIDVRHNPEFTMLEAYQAFADYVDMMDLVEGMVVAAIRDALDGNFVVKVGDHTVDLTPPWPRITMSDLIEQKLGARMDATMPVEQARAILDGLNIEWENGWGSGKLMKQVVDEKIQHDIVDPIFCIDYPEEVSPLARVHRSRPGYVERFELMVAGFELCNAYSEQNDAKQQLAAFEMEARAKAEGDPEAGDVDLDYVRALEYGLPCTGGLGIGIDRLVMLLSEADNIREVILFPTMRPEGGTPGPSGPSRRTGSGGLGRITPLPVQAAAGAPEAAAPAPVTSLVMVPPDTTTIEERQHERRRGKRIVRTLGALAAFGGLMMLLTLIPFFHSRYQPFGTPIGPLWFRVTGHLVTTVIGLMLLFLAGQVARGKRRAWQICTVFFLLGVVTNVLKGPHPVSAAYCAVLAAALLSYRRYFRARSDPPSLLRLVWLAPLYVDRRAGVRLHQPRRGAASPRRAAHHLRRPRDHRQGTGRGWWPLQLRAVVLRRLLPGSHAHVRDHRRDRARLPALPAVAFTSAAHRERLGPRAPAGAALRLRHPRLLRAAR